VVVSLHFSWSGDGTVENLCEADGIWTLARKMTSFRFPENVFVRLGLRVRVGENTFKNVFG